MRKVSAILVLFTFVMVLSACGNNAKTAKKDGEVTARIGVLRGAEPLSLAQEGGPLQKRIEAAGAKLDKSGSFPALAPAIEALNAGSIDITIGSITAAISALVGDASEFTIFARQESAYNNTGIVAKPESGIKSAADLKGKKVAVNRGGTGEYLLYKALDKGGIKPSEVEIVYLPPTEAGPAFGNGEVDAWATWGAFTSLAVEQHGAELVIPASDIGTQNDVVFVVRTEFLKVHPQLVREIYEGLREEAELSAENFEETVKLIKDTQNVSEQVARRQAEEAVIPVEPVDDVIRKRWQGIADYVFEKGIIPESVGLDSYTVDVQTIED
ncbi:sulfonate transport system substrate-binding protein [Neobacillus niacini]|uniref:ABC transporter substrate-binding protein n=1 Tax=Neobacillus niacini TaxID=86668 RepID=UPI002862C6D8|nr:aliphatic sulfonate ABC transporter substrate-binding protein [Neobacillus niacini]MDR7079305.1 sulfonate transport system substrate-binding protein [Neobacillus niacini]